MIDVPFNPKAEKPLDMITATLLSDLHRVARDKFGVVQARHKLVTFCRDGFGCEIEEISIQAAKWMLTHLNQLPTIAQVRVPPRQQAYITEPLAAPPVMLDEAVFGKKL